MPVPRPWVGSAGIQARNTLTVVLKAVKLIVFLFASLQSVYPTLELKRPRNGGLRCLIHSSDPSFRDSATALVALATCGFSSPIVYRRGSRRPSWSGLEYESP